MFIHWVTVVLGAWFVISAWMLRPPGGVILSNSIAGLFIIAISLIAMRVERMRWANLAAALWIAFSPIFLGARGVLLGSNLFFGVVLLVAALAPARLFRLEDEPTEQPPLRV